MIEGLLAEGGGKFTLVTQNVDGLHTKAGSENVIEVHGSARHMRCSRTGCENGAPHGLLAWDDEVFATFRADPVFSTLPRCPKCRKLLRAHVLWFDESYMGHDSYGLDAIRRVICDEPLTAIVFIGTSFAVNITVELTWGADDHLVVQWFGIDLREPGGQTLLDELDPEDRLTPLFYGG